MLKNNLWKIVSFASIMGALMVVLYLVVLYKVTWETKDFNKYLYFYSCSDLVCTTENKPAGIEYNKIICENDKCPYISSVLGDIVLLNNDDKSWLYDYKKGEVYSDSYIKYELLSNECFKVTDNNFMQAIMNKDLELLTTKKYEKIIDYSHGMIAYEEKGKQGLDYASGEAIISPKYDELVIIDNTMYYALNGNKYQIYNVVNNAPKNNVKYDYIWSNNNGVIMTVYNNQLDIVNNKLESNLLIKVRTYFDYTTSAERKSLKITADKDYIYFNVNTSNFEYQKYKYDIANKKILKND